MCRIGWDSHADYAAAELGTVGEVLLVGVARPDLYRESRLVDAELHRVT